MGQTASRPGEHTSLVVLPLFAVLTLDAGAGQVGALRAVGQVPILLLSLVGAWVDRWRTRTVRVLTDAGRPLAPGAAAVAGLLGGLVLPVLLVVAFTVGALSVLRRGIPGVLGPAGATGSAASSGRHSRRRGRARSRGRCRFPVCRAASDIARCSCPRRHSATARTGACPLHGSSAVTLTPDGTQGRVAATITCVGRGPTPLGSLLGGFRAQAWGTRTGLLVTAAGTLLAPALSATPVAPREVVRFTEALWFYANFYLFGGHAVCVTHERCDEGSRGWAARPRETSSGACRSQRAA